MTQRRSILIFGEEKDRGIVRTLEAAGFAARRIPEGLSLTTILDGGRPDGVVVVLPKANQDKGMSALNHGVASSAKALGVPVVGVLEIIDDLGGAADLLADYDDWLVAERLEQELPLRLLGVLKRFAPEKDKLTGHKSTPLNADSHFFSLVIHDLRTPLNVIGLSLRMVGQALPKDDPEVEEDLRFIEDNFNQIERMLMQLSDYFRLFENNGPIVPVEFSPRRAVEELLAWRSSKPSLRLGKVNTVIDDSCPEVVALDPVKARLALSYVLANAAAAAGNSPIQMVLSGRDGRFLVETTIETPPPTSVTSTVLTPSNFVRLCGFAAERRGMDLAVAAKVSEMFGGTARLDVSEQERSIIVLDWPVRL